MEQFDGPEIQRRGKPPLKVTYQVNYVDGDEGERLRAEIADATRDLLRHFATEQERRHRSD
ncbi:MAG: hypothetical protein ACRDQ7_18440 [Haloechinothrix sp.]